MKQETTRRREAFGRRTDGCAQPSEQCVTLSGSCGSLSRASRGSADDRIHASFGIEVALRDPLDVRQGHAPDILVDLVELPQRSEHERVDNLAQHGATALHSDLVDTHGISLRALELFGRYAAVANLPELVEQSGPRRLLLVGRSRDVGDESPRSPSL